MRELTIDRSPDTSGESTGYLYVMNLFDVVVKPTSVHSLPISSHTFVAHARQPPTTTMGFCALNGMFWAAAAGFVGGMVSCPPEARAMTAHGQFMAKKKEKVRLATEDTAPILFIYFYSYTFHSCKFAHIHIFFVTSSCYPFSTHRRIAGGGCPGCGGGGGEGTCHRTSSRHPFILMRAPKEREQTPALYTHSSRHARTHNAR